MVIDYSSSSCIGGFHQSSKPPIVRPETLVRWHRAGFRRYWRWKSRSLGGRPQIDGELRALIRRMSVDNPLWQRRASTASCSSSALRSLSPASRSIWSSEADCPPLGGAPSYVTMCTTSPPCGAGKRMATYISALFSLREGCVRRQAVCAPSCMIRPQELIAAMTCAAERNFLAIASVSKK